MVWIYQIELYVHSFFLLPILITLKLTRHTDRSNFHPISTAAIMPKEIGGVVDTSLKVYGTSNVRIVDGSVLPFQVCGRLQATIYAVAERAADIIKSGI